MILFTQRTIGHAGDKGGVAAACTVYHVYSKYTVMIKAT